MTISAQGHFKFPISCIDKVLVAPGIFTTKLVKAAKKWTSARTIDFFSKFL